MKIFKKFNPIYLLGVSLISIASVLSYGTSWLMFNEVEPPKSLLK